MLFFRFSHVGGRCFKANKPRRSYSDSSCKPIKQVFNEVVILRLVRPIIFFKRGHCLLLKFIYLAKSDILRRCCSAFNISVFFILYPLCKDLLMFHRCNVSRYLYKVNRQNTCRIIHIMYSFTSLSIY